MIFQRIEAAWPAWLAISTQACYLQVSMWRGISLAIVAYARTVLEGNVSCREARAKWREAGGHGLDLRKMTSI